MFTTKTAARAAIRAHSLKARIFPRFYIANQVRLNSTDHTDPKFNFPTPTGPSVMTTDLKPVYPKFVKRQSAQKSRKEDHTEGSISKNGERPEPTNLHLKQSILNREQKSEREEYKKEPTANNEYTPKEEKSTEPTNSVPKESTPNSDQKSKKQEYTKDPSTETPKEEEYATDSDDRQPIPTSEQNSKQGYYRPWETDMIVLLGFWGWAIMFSTIPVILSCYQDCKKCNKKLIECEGKFRECVKKNPPPEEKNPRPEERDAKTPTELVVPFKKLNLKTLEDEVKGMDVIGKTDDSGEVSEDGEKGGGEAKENAEKEGGGKRGVVGKRRRMLRRRAGKKGRRGMRRRLKNFGKYLVTISVLEEDLDPNLRDR